MSIEELRVLKKFPKGQEEIEVSDRAKIVLSRRQIKQYVGGKISYKYKAVVTFTYKNGQDYDFVYEEKSMKKVLSKSIKTFDQRNKQMISYEGGN